MHRSRSSLHQRPRRRLIPPPSQRRERHGSELISAPGDGIKLESDDGSISTSHAHYGEEPDNPDTIPEETFDEMNPEFQAMLLEQSRMGAYERAQRDWPPERTIYKSFADTYNPLHGDERITLQELRTRSNLPVLPLASSGTADQSVERAKQFVTAVFRSIDPEFHPSGEDWGLGERRLDHGPTDNLMLTQEDMATAALNVSHVMLPKDGNISKIPQHGAMLEDMHIDAFLWSLAFVKRCRRDSSLRPFAPFPLTQSWAFLTAGAPTDQFFETQSIEIETMITNTLANETITRNVGGACNYTLGNMLSTGRIVIPINYGSGDHLLEGGCHFAILLVDLRRRHAYYMDPLPDPSGLRPLHAKSGFEALMDIIEALDDAKRKDYGLTDRGEVLDKRTWQEWCNTPRTFSDPIARSGVPHQTDSATCGLFVCYYAWRWALGHPVDEGDESGDAGLVPIIHDPACTSEYMDRYMRYALWAHLYSLYRWNGRPLPVPSQSASK